MNIEKEKTVQNMKNALMEICEVSYNKTVGINENPIGKIFDRNKVVSGHHRKGVMEYLKANDLLLTEGIRRGMSYRWTGGEIKDFDAIAEKCYAMSKTFIPIITLRKKDLVPFLPPKEKTPKFKAIVLEESKKFSLMQLAWVIHNDKIYEGKIIGMELTDEDRTRIKLAITIEFLTGHKIEIVDRSSRSVFHNAESAIKYISSKVQRFSEKIYRENPLGKEK